MSIGGYNCLIKYLAELENTSTTKVVRFKDKPKISGDKFGVKEGKRYYNPRIVLLKGGVKSIQTPTETLPIDIEFDYWEINQSKTISDFKTPVKSGKKVRICEGGGWYSQGHQYIVNDRIFEF